MLKELQNIFSINGLNINFHKIKFMTNLTPNGHIDNVTDVVELLTKCTYLCYEIRISRENQSSKPKRRIRSPGQLSVNYLMYLKATFQKEMYMERSPRREGMYS